MKKEGTKYSRELAKIRMLLSEAEAARLKAIEKEQLRSLEEASLLLREKERELICKMGEEIAKRIENDSRSLNELATQIRSRIEKSGKMPKRLDKITKVILKIAEIADSVKEKAEKN
jgi:23S rRNA A1618 N6-methylase RlmF